MGVEYSNPIALVYTSNHRGKKITIVEYYDDALEENIKKDLAFFQAKFGCEGKMRKKGFALVGNYIHDIEYGNDSGEDLKPIENE